ncbi:DUF72 domain-containing protein [Mucilaginibacter agri]|uniref:DUF72 domain-containing protein n=1 Tax=Mucilaginibacter agri TaxID=2695265 RepID=A0A965ZDN5_9SPHI|nr:DUF72 domain-containing protein [Mucilaginibacter agri]NCD68338.1 DUF72 domain-containing protein [Mucilaginibacter agri]
MPGQFYGGTSGIKIPMPKRDFPKEHAEKSRLAYYAHHLNSLEVNNSFYQLPMAKTVSKWAADVPLDFRFTFKLWKEITHQKNLIFKAEDVIRFLHVINISAEKRGCLLVQFPPSVQIGALGQLEELLQLLSTSDWTVAVEFRHNSWYNDKVYELLNSFQVAMVIQDMPKAPSPLEVTSDELIYLRFHGPEGNYKGSYSEDLLYEYATYIQDWLQENKNVYCYFNNTAGDALNNLNLLKSYLKI